MSQQVKSVGPESGSDSTILSLTAQHLSKSPNRRLAVRGSYGNHCLGPVSERPTQNNIHRPFTLFMLSLSLSLPITTIASKACHAAVAMPRDFTASLPHGFETTTPRPPRPSTPTLHHDTGEIRTVALIHTNGTTCGRKTYRA